MSDRVGWPEMRSLLSDANPERAAIHQWYPEAGTRSFFDALEEVDGDSAAAIRNCGRRADSAARLAACPILAVAGMLNAGKTTLVATFLGPAGRARSLRGEANDQGTHRFVLWLPARWQQDSELWGLLMARLGEAIGHAPEMLASDPAEAHDQYNNRDGDAARLGIPLVASDASLDEIGFGLLDCPDIVTSDRLGKGTGEVRRELLKKGATLCSAFLAVTAFHSLNDSTLDDVLQIAAETMPGIPRMLAINLVRPRYAPDEVRRQAQPLIDQHGIERLFIAYDYEIAASDSWVPTAETRAAGDEPLPVFYEPSAAEQENPPAPISSERLLRSLPRQLDRPEMFQRFTSALETRMQESVREGWETLRGAVDAQHRAAEEARARLLDVALEFFAHRGAGGVVELRLHQSTEIVNQLADAFARAAPWYARLGLSLHGVTGRLGRAATDTVRRLAPTTAARAKAEEVRDRFRTGREGRVITPGALRDALRRHDAIARLPGGLEGDDARLLERCRQAVERFDREDRARLDPERLDAAARQLWSQVSLGQRLKVGTALGFSLASFAAVLLLPIDAGATVVAAASVKELLAAAGLSLVATGWGGIESARAVEQSTARQQTADFLAVLHDTFGVPVHGPQLAEFRIRMADGGHVHLPAPQVASRPESDGAMRMWEIQKPFEKRLKKMLRR